MEFYNQTGRMALGSRLGLLIDKITANAKEPLQIKWFGDSFIKVPVWR